MRNVVRLLAKKIVHGTLARTRRTFAAKTPGAPSLSVFTYHSFCTGSAPRPASALPVVLFERQLRLLRKTHRLVSLSEGLRALEDERHGPVPMATVTIDDGFEDNYHVAFPLLVRLGVPATIFVATDFIDTGDAPWPTRLWDIVRALDARRARDKRRATTALSAPRYAQLQRKLRSLNAVARQRVLDELATTCDAGSIPSHTALSWAQIRQMADAGIAIGSHTVHHGYLPYVDTVEATRELCDSKRRIEQELQRECIHFAYPNGDWSAASADLVRAAGYADALTQDYGTNTQDQYPFAMKRIEVPSSDPLASFDYRAQRALSGVGKQIGGSR